MGAVFALATAAAAVTTGMHATFAVATALVGEALAIAEGSGLWREGTG